MDHEHIAAAAVLKLWQQLETSGHFQLLCMGAPDAALEEAGVRLPPGLELRYAHDPAQEEHRFQVLGVPGMLKTFVFGIEDGLKRVEVVKRRPTEDRSGPKRGSRPEDGPPPGEHLREA